MDHRRRITFAVVLALILPLCTHDSIRCAAQMMDSTGQPGDPGNANKTTSQDGGATQQKQAGQTQATQTVGPIVAGPGSTVVAPAPSAGNNGLIVAAPGATVVVQQLPQTSQAKGNTASKTNSLTTKDRSTIDRLGEIAKKTGNTFYQRAGAIDALGLLGTGADQTTVDAIVQNLNAVLEVEYINSRRGALRFRDNEAGTSQFLCFHVVQAVGSLGWYARCALPNLQLLRGNDTILDSAIDHAVSSMQTSQPPPSANSGTGSKMDGAQTTNTQQSPN